MTRALILGVVLLAIPLHAQDAKGTCSEGNGFRRINGEVVQDYGTVGHPLHGWVGYTNTGTPVSGMAIECYAGSGKLHLASTTTDSSGSFSFPNLKEGTYYLKGTAKNISAIRILVRVRKSSKAVACVVTEAEANSQ